MHFWSVFERSADHSEIESSRKNKNNSNNPAAAATMTTTTLTTTTTTTTTATPTTTTTCLNPLRNRHVRSSSSIRVQLILLLHGQRCQEFNELQMTTEGVEALYNADQLKAGKSLSQGWWGLEFLLKVGGFYWMFQGIFQGGNFSNEGGMF